VIASLEDLLEQHAWAALRISGADQTAWNGEIVEAGEGILGLAHWDGTLHLDRDQILEPLRDLYDRAGGPRTEAELLRSREALVTLLHEQSHFLGPAGATQEAARAAFKLPGGRALEEGVAEAWAHNHLNEYIRELGIDKVAPGILHVRSEPSYAAFVPAVRLLAADLDRLSGAPDGETLDLLNRQTAEGQWQQAVTRVYHSTKLPHLVPPDQAPAVRLHLEQALRSSFKALELYEPLPRGFAASRSQAAATRTLTFLHQELTTAERHYTPVPRPTRIHLSPPPMPASGSSAPAEISAPTHRLTPADSHQAAAHAFAGVSPPTAHPPTPPTVTANAAAKATTTTGAATSFRDLER
jgi:hypothetical protein